LTGYDLSPLVDSWARSLRSRSVSPNTERVYLRAAGALAAFIASYEPGPGMKPAPAGPDDIHREHIEAFITHATASSGAATAAQYFRSVRTFLNWLVEEEELDRSPMRRMKPPQTTEKEVPVIDDGDIRRLLATCKGKDFVDRRDTALLLMFIDTGGRLSEIMIRTKGKLDLDINVLHVKGKGDKERPLPFGRTTALAVDRYLRAAARYLGRPLEDDDPLWISYKRRDALGVWGMEHMLKRRCAAAGVPPINPHRFRHTFAHAWQVAGGGDDALMRIMGWSSREMLNRYGRSAGEERARRRHGEISPGDRFK
jgi:site-specific recombinase XerD